MNDLTAHPPVAPTRPPLRPRAAPIIDIEASGFGADGYPIEVGCALPNGRRVCTLIRPAEDWTHWDPEAEKLHGISRETLLKHGRSIPEVCRWLDEEVGTRLVYSDAWHLDWGWINRLYDAAGRVPRLRMESLRALFTEEEAARWHETVETVVQRLKPRRHRAATDAMILQKAYIEIVSASAVAAPRKLLASSAGWQPHLPTSH